MNNFTRRSMNKYLIFILNSILTIALGAFFWAELDILLQGNTTALDNIVAGAFILGLFASFINFYELMKDW